jgi:glycoside/pentoside/hexuronide:cation symporter, GPH family
MIKENLKLKEKIGYALGDGAANIAWRGVSTFLFIFYTDVFGLAPAAIGLLFLIARGGDGVVDIVMGIIGDRTESKYGKFRPWILWSAIPLGAILSLLFLAPELSNIGKIIYAYTTYLLFMVIYTANNIPYGALMAVMTTDDKERTSIGSFRMVGAFAGGMIVQGALLYLVMFFGNVNPTMDVKKLDSEKYKVTVSSKVNVANANIKTKNGIAMFKWADTLNIDSTQTQGKSFAMEAGTKYSFIVAGEKDIDESCISLINQKKGYSHSMYLMSFFLAFFMIITFLSTRERVKPPKVQKNNLKKDLKQLFKNRPWLILLFIGVLFNIYNSIKQGIVVIYFSHYLHNQLLAASFMVGLTLASIFGAIATTPLNKIFGKKGLFVFALIFSGIVNALLVFCGPKDIGAIFTIGIISEFAAAIFPTLFFAMLGDAADHSEFINKRRATGLIYSAGSFATKLGQGLAGAIIGLVLAAFCYNGQDNAAIQGAVPGIIMLMSWVPTIVALIAAGIMSFYPLNQHKMNEITLELNNRRANELA